MNPSRAAACIVAACLRRFNRMHERSRLEAQRLLLAGLSDATLRDIGIDRSELTSCWAEQTGRAELTRRCVGSVSAFQVGP